MNDIIEKTMKNLRKNNMAAYYVEKKEQVVPLIKEIVPQGSSVSNGGSESLVECGVFDLLESGYYDFIDRRKYDAETVRECYIKAFGCDAFFCSSNAVTENGELYNVDGNSNRVACIVYGPSLQNSVRVNGRMPQPCKRGCRDLRGLPKPAAHLLQLCCFGSAKA